MNRIYKHLAKCDCWDSAGSAGTAGGSAQGAGGSGFGAGAMGRGSSGGGESDGSDTSSDSDTSGLGGAGLADGSYGGMNSPTGGFSTGQASAPGLGFGGMYGGGAFGSAYSNALSAFGLSNTPSADQGLTDALTKAGIDPAAYSISNLGDITRNIGLGNYAEGQIVGSNITPTTRQRVQGALFGQNFTPSTQGLADAIGLGATQTDLTRGYNSGNLGSNDQGDVTADTFGQLSSVFSTPLSVLGLGPFGLAKMGLMAALGAPLSKIGPTPGITSPLGALGVVRSAYNNYGDLAAASRALGMRGGYGEAESDIARGQALSGTPATAAGTSGSGNDWGFSSGGLAQAASPGTNRVNTTNASWRAPNAGWNLGVLNSLGLYRG